MEIYCSFYGLIKTINGQRQYLADGYVVRVYRGAFVMGRGQS